MYTTPTFTLLVLLTSSALAESPCTRNVVFDAAHNTAFDKDREEYVQVTTVTFSIGRGETVCFTIQDKDKVSVAGVSHVLVTWLLF